MRPSTPPKPPLRRSPAGFAGSRVTPASDVTGLPTASTMSRASSRASAVPPRMRMRLFRTAYDLAAAANDHDIERDLRVAQVVAGNTERHVGHELADIELSLLAKVEHLL